MTTMNSEIKKVIDRAKTAQNKLQSLLKNQDWIEDARKYAEKQSKEVRKLIAGDVTRVKNFLEKERKELERFQKQIPGEVAKLKKYVNVQKKELEKLLANVRKAGAGRKGGKKKASGGKKKPSKKASKKASSGSASASSHASA